MTKHLLLFSFFWGCFSRSEAQQHDRYWLSGYSVTATPPFLANVIDFATSPPTVTADTLAVETVGATGTMSDADGNLLFYTNGGQVLGRAKLSVVK